MKVRHFSLAGMLLFLASYVCGQSSANPSQIGVTVVGPNLHITTGRAYYTVANARVQAQAMQLAGGADKLVFVDPEETKKFGDGDGYERFWNYWKFREGK